MAKDFDAPVAFTNVILCCPVCQTADEYEPDDLIEFLVCDNCSTLYSVNGAPIILTMVAPTWENDQFTGAIVYCPVDGSSFDVEHWGTSSFECVNCENVFDVYVEPDRIHRYSMYG